MIMLRSIIFGKIIHRDVKNTFVNESIRKVTKIISPILKIQKRGITYIPHAASIIIDSITISEHFIEFFPRLDTDKLRSVFNLATYGYRPTRSSIDILQNYAILDLTNDYLQKTKEIFSARYLNSNMDIMYHIESYLSPLHRYPSASQDFLSYFKVDGNFKTFMLYSLEGRPDECILKFYYLSGEVLLQGNFTDDSIRFNTDPWNKVTLTDSYTTLRYLEVPSLYPY